MQHSGSTYINNRQIDWQQGMLYFQGSSTNIEPKLLQVLSVLVATPDQVVSQQQLLDMAWPETLVSANTVQRCIGQLRKLLGDDAHQQKVIKTLPKRGYSLNSQSIQPATSSKARPSTGITLTLVTALLGVIAAVTFFSEQELQVIHLVPASAFDGAQAQQHTPAVSPTGQWLAYVQNSTGLQQVKLKHRQQQTTQLLFSYPDIGSSLAFAPDSNKLVLSVIEKGQHSKCSQLQTLTLNKGEVQPQLDCRDGFYSHLHWPQPDKLLYLWRQKDQSSHLELLHLQSGKLVQLSNRWGKIHSFAYHAPSQSLALLLDDKKLAFTRLEQDKLVPLSVITLPDKLAIPKQLLWSKEGDLQLVVDNKLYTYANQDWHNSLSLSSEKQLTHLLALDDGEHYLAQLELDNWDIHLKTPQTAILKITNDGFRDRAARFAPAAKGISFLSNRSGVTQVWLKQGAKLQQFSNAKADISAHLWSEDGSTLYYLDQLGLWQQTQTQRQQLLVAGPKITGISQITNGQLLLGVKINGQQQIALFDPLQQTLKPIIKHEFHWAQFIGTETLITNDSRGRLQKYVQGVQKPITALPDFIIQPYYFAVQQQLYVQDKGLNIWAYDPINETAKIVDHYDINSVFMTDYSPEDKSLLTENFIHRQQQLVWLTPLEH